MASRVMPASTEAPSGGVTISPLRTTNISGRCLRSRSCGVERDALAVAVDERCHLDELRVHVIGPGLGHRRSVLGAKRFQLETLTSTPLASASAMISSKSSITSRFGAGFSAIPRC